MPTPDGSGYRRYGGAFDIVLSVVPIFLQAKTNPPAKGRRAEFGPCVKALRDNGYVAWHRWAGEAPSTSENEMHCIDPAMPFLKNKLANVQIPEFLAGETGGSSYHPEPPYDPRKSDAQQNKFAITPGQKQAVKKKLNNPRVVPGFQKDNVSP